VTKSKKSLWSWRQIDGTGVFSRDPRDGQHLRLPDLCRRMRHLWHFMSFFDVRTFLQTLLAFFDLLSQFFHIPPIWPCKKTEKQVWAVQTSKDQAIFRVESRFTRLVCFCQLQAPHRFQTKMGADSTHTQSLPVDVCLERAPHAAMRMLMLWQCLGMSRNFFWNGTHLSCNQCPIASKAHTPTTEVPSWNLGLCTIRGAQPDRHKSVAL
jgi:hypothetical protein